MAAAAATNTTESPMNVSHAPNDLPVCVIVLGMAGSGKTTFVRKFAQLAYEAHKPYIINLDPACREVPYNANIDIRDTVNYKEVMKQYKLGPNGGIVTSLNLFTTKLDKVIDLVRAAGEKGHKLCIIDTPGQIEVFTWSASGNLITDGFASMFPTIVVYVMDVARSICPTTFMSNMLYACSILYKSNLPFIIVLNKIDMQDPGFINEWMTDFETFDEALQEQNSYVNNLTRSLSLTLDTFYEHIRTCGVSSMTGAGFNRFFEMLPEAAEEYKKDYKDSYNKIREERLSAKAKTVVTKSSTSSSSHAGTEVPLKLQKLTINNNDTDDNETIMATKDQNEIFLRQPADSDTETTDNEMEMEMESKVEGEEEHFQNFVMRHKTANLKKQEKQQNEQNDQKI